MGSIPAGMLEKAQAEPNSIQQLWRFVEPAALPRNVHPERLTSPKVTGCQWGKMAAGWACYLTNTWVMYPPRPGTVSSHPTLTVAAVATVVPLHLRKQDF